MEVASGLKGQSYLASVSINGCDLCDKRNGEESRIDDLRACRRIKRMDKDLVPVDRHVPAPAVPAAWLRSAPTRMTANAGSMPWATSRLTRALQSARRPAATLVPSIIR